MNETKEKVRTFLDSMLRNRKEFSEERARNLASDAADVRHDVLRSVNKDIRQLEAKLTSMENDAFEDDLIVALKKGGDFDVEKHMVTPRYETLFALRTLYIKRNIIQGDNYFGVPTDVTKPVKGAYEDLVGTDDLVAIDPTIVDKDTKKDK